MTMVLSQCLNFIFAFNPSKIVTDSFDIDCMILEFGNITEDMHFLFFFITKDPDHYLKKKRNWKRQEKRRGWKEETCNGQCYQNGICLAGQFILCWKIFYGHNSLLSVYQYVP